MRRHLIVTESRRTRYVKCSDAQDHIYTVEGALSDERLRREQTERALKYALPVSLNAGQIIADFLEVGGVVRPQLQADGVSVKFELPGLRVVYVAAKGKLEVIAGAIGEHREFSLENGCLRKNDLVTLVGLYGGKRGAKPFPETLSLTGMSEEPLAEPTWVDPCGGQEM